MQNTLAGSLSILEAVELMMKEAPPDATSPLNMLLSQPDKLKRMATGQLLHEVAAQALGILDVRGEHYITMLN